MQNVKGLLPVMGLNVALWMGIAVVGLHSPHAHAISAKYRAELERTHTTQVQDANGQTHQNHLKPIHVRKFGQDFKRGNDGIAYFNGHACAQDEQNAQATVYSSGTYQIIVRHTGRVDLMNNGQFVGHMN